MHFALYALKARGMPPRALTAKPRRCDNACCTCRASRRSTSWANVPSGSSSSSPTAARYAGRQRRSIFDALQRQNVVTPCRIDRHQRSASLRSRRRRVRRPGEDRGHARSPPTAACCKLPDIAEVKRGYEDPPTYRIRHDGEPAHGARHGDAGWLERPRAGCRRSTEKRRARTQNCQLASASTKVTDQAVNIRESVDEFMLKFVAALAVVMIVSLRASAGVVV